MPRVNIEEIAFSDQRFELLGSIAGYNRFEALGRMAHLWRVSTQRGSYTVSDAIVAACLGPRGPEAIIAAELGERVPDGIRVRGSEGRTDWVSTKQAGGRARASMASRDARGRLLPRSAGPAEPADESSSSSREPAGVQALYSLLSSPEEGGPPDLDQLPEPPDLGAAVRVERDQGRTPPPGIPAPGGGDPRVRLNHDVWRYAAMEHVRLREEGISPDTVLWPAMPAGAAASDLVARTREVLAQTDPPDFAAARALIKRRIDVAVAEAKREHHLNWFTPMRIWDERGFWRATEVTPEQAAKPRAPARSAMTPRGTPEPERRRLKPV